MLQHQPQKVFPGEGAGAGLARSAVDIAKGHLAILTGDNILFGNDAAIEIAGQILQGR